MNEERKKERRDAVLQTSENERGAHELKNPTNFYVFDNINRTKSFYLGVYQGWYA